MKALFCGLGSIGQRHIRNLRTLYGDAIEVIAWRERDSSPVLNADMTVRSGAKIETHYNIRSFTNLETALKEQPDVVFVTNPNTLHLPTAMASAKAGCHLFIEKPISHEVRGVGDLIDIAEERGLITFVAYQFRFHPAFQFIKCLIEQGRLGTLTGAHIVNGEYLPDWHPYEDYRTSHPARKELGGGCLNIQTHELDYAQWLLGLPKRVYAVGGKLSHLETDTEDAVDLLWECSENSHVLPVHLRLDYLQRPPQRVCEIIGDEGRLYFDYYSNQVEFYERGSRKRETHNFAAFDRNQMFLSELNHFFDCIENGAQTSINLREGYKSLQIAEACYLSLKMRQAVELNHE